MSAAPWAKIWWTWYSSRSHLGLSGVALALGPPLILICRESGKRHCDAQSDARCAVTDTVTHLVTKDLVWAFDKASKPITPNHLSSIARFPAAEVKDALIELLDSETLILSAGGIYGFPNFWRYQETSSAARMRKQRRGDKRHSDAHSDVGSDTKSDGVCDGQRVEGRGKRKEERGREIFARGGAREKIPAPKDSDAPPEAIREQRRMALARAPTPDVMGMELAVSMAAAELKWRSPKIPNGQLYDGAQRVETIHAKEGWPREEIASALARAALGEAQRQKKPGMAGLLLMTIDPWAADTRDVTKGFVPVGTVEGTPTDLDGLFATAAGVK